MTTVTLDEGALREAEEEETLDEMMERAQAEQDPTFQSNPATIGPSDRPPSWLEVPEPAQSLRRMGDQYVDTVTYDMLDRGVNALKAAGREGDFGEEYEYLDAQRRGEKSRDWVTDPKAMTLGTAGGVVTPDPFVGPLVKAGKVLAKGGGKVAGHAQRAAEGVPVLGLPHKWGRRAKVQSKAEGRLKRLTNELFGAEKQSRNADIASRSDEMFESMSGLAVEEAADKLSAAKSAASRKGPISPEMAAAREAEIAAREKLIKAKSSAAADKSSAAAQSQELLAEAAYQKALRDAEAARRRLDLKEVKDLSGMSNLGAGSKGQEVLGAERAAIEAGEQLAGAKRKSVGGMTGGAMAAGSEDLVRKANEGHQLSKVEIDRLQLMADKAGESGPTMELAWLEAALDKAKKNNRGWKADAASSKRTAGNLKTAVDAKAHEVGRQSQRLDRLGGARSERVRKDLRELSDRYTAAIPNQAGKFRAAVRNVWNQKGYAARALDDLAAAPWSSYGRELKETLPSLRKAAARTGGQAYDEFLARALEDPQFAYEIKLAATQAEAMERRRQLKKNAPADPADPGTDTLVGY